MFLSCLGQGGREALEHREQFLLTHLTKDLQALGFLSVGTHFCFVGTTLFQKASVALAVFQGQLLSVACGAVRPLC